MRTGSFRNAAKEWDISQPAISGQIQRLEEDLGIVLFLRGNYGVRATDAARRLLPHALAAIRAETSIREETGAILGFQNSRLRVASVVAGSQLILLNLLREFRKDHPDVQVEVTECGSDSIRAGVTNGIFDIGLITRLGSDEIALDRFDVIDLCHGQLKLCVPEDHAFTKQTVFDPSALGSEPIIWHKHGSILRRALEKLAEDVSVHTVYTTDSTESVQNLVSAGVGISIANTLTLAQTDLKGVAMVPIPYEWAQTRLSIILRPKQKRTPAITTLIQLANEVSARRAEADRRL